MVPASIVSIDNLRKKMYEGDGGPMQFLGQRFLRRRSAVLSRRSIARDKPTTTPHGLMALRIGLNALRDDLRAR